MAKKLNFDSIFPNFYGSETLHSSARWLKRKAHYDDIGNLWRIDDDLLDLSEFKLSGGQFWIEKTRGTPRNICRI